MSKQDEHSKHKKKIPTDPNPEEINPELIQFAREIGFLRGPFNLYLEGMITYREALELMLIVMTKEYRHIMSRIIKKKIKQREDHSALVENLLPAGRVNPLALPAPGVSEAEYEDIN